MFYIAGGFFNDEQKEVISNIENAVTERGHKFFSPREYGVIKDTPMTRERMSRIYDMNIRMIEEADAIIAVIDNYDTGTVFEMGYAAALGIDIITYSPKEYEVNIMLKNAIIGHCKSLEEISKAIIGVYSNNLGVSE